MKPIYSPKLILGLVGIIFCLFSVIGLLESCSKSNPNYVYEEMVLIDMENSNKVADVYSFDKWQVDYIKKVQEYIPMRAEITYVDTKGFVYFDLGKSSFAVKWIDSDAHGHNFVIIYPLDANKKKRR